MRVVGWQSRWQISADHAPLRLLIPTKATVVPTGPDWLHEIKYYGYRLRLERDDRGVRLITRGNYNFADRYPWIVEATLKIHEQQHDRRCDGQGADSNYKGINFFVIPHAAAYSGGT